MNTNKSELCRCFSGQTYELCCKPFHTEQKLPNPTQLMRSRYCAYALGKIDYIIQTTHPDNPQIEKPIEVWKKRMQHFCDQTEFVGLQILSHEDGVETAYVTFRAGLIQNHQDASFTERSKFLKHEGRWKYFSRE
jgi:SEC-C motif-containing protein